LRIFVNVVVDFGGKLGDALPPPPLSGLLTELFSDFSLV
jgi:hypothetical protein